TLTYHLKQLEYKVSRELLGKIQATFQNNEKSNSQSVLLYDAIDQLQQLGALDHNATQTLKLGVSKEALESLFWLRNARHAWIEQEVKQTELASFAAIITQLEQRLKNWVSLGPTITSPYQRPYCPDRSKLTQPVPNGQLNESLLTLLAQLMKGNSIHQLALFLKQDSLKVAYLLKPYIQQQYFVLQPPSAPYDKLPNISALAITQPPSQARQAPLKANDKPQFIKKIRKVVCIDDSPAMLETIQGYLGTQNFEVATIENPMESMSALFSMKPDLILMDVSMPGINGNRLCEILRRGDLFKEIPIIMISSNASVLDKAKSESSGATDYLTKPFTKDDLLKIIEKHLSIFVHA
ncbi:MAG: response regulator, partial [Cyanobacteria bacterium P01_F01_bin.86]